MPDDPNADHARLAIDAAFDMLKERENLNLDLKTEGKTPILSGIGLHSGSVLAGTIGSKLRMEYTVIGDTVNVVQNHFYKPRGRLNADCRLACQRFANVQKERTAR